MNSQVKRIFVEKKKKFAVEAESLYRDIKETLNIKDLVSLRIIHRYDIEGISEEEYERSKNTIYSEPPVDVIYEETLQFDDGSKIVAIEYLPGQYDQRADSAAQCTQILTGRDMPKVKVAKLIVLEGSISDDDYKTVKDYLINPVESHEAEIAKPLTLNEESIYPADIKIIDGFTKMSDTDIKDFMAKIGFAMSLEDLKFCRDYFRDTEKRDPSITELKVIDTYWSDHCRHTTFLTNINDVKIEEGEYSSIIEEAYKNYIRSRDLVYSGKDRDICLMDIATIAMKELKKNGKLNDIDESDEINACSIVVNVDVDDVNEEWLIMFKNETHNHPTEIEPFGGAATCLGGAIRDPLSGRSYVYQAMRVTGSGDPRTSIKDTIPGKLPQKKITTSAAAGYSSYGNQIGLATGQVAEIYDEGYVAKRMEIGAVIGAAPRKNVRRSNPENGDVVILLGGRTGRDGCGGATGSSKEHTEESLASCGAEVQKGNALTERKIQRLFRDLKVSTMIKKCNDFGAGGVCVAIGELADGLEIMLDNVPKKYEGLDGTELAISESQERMAVVVNESDKEKFIKAAKEENLEATVVGTVNDSGRLKMYWRDSTIVDISRDFLNTNGVKQNTDIKVLAVPKENNFFAAKFKIKNLKEAWENNLGRLNVCSQKGLVERFDSTVGAGTVLMPFGGIHQLTPEEGMVAKVPVLNAKTNTATVMTYGFNSEVSKWSPFHGAVYAVIEAIAKVVAIGGNFRNVRLTLQEYFEKLGNDPEKWGKPFSALLGAYYVQTKLSIPAIGGKDSMSGTFLDKNVPPTLVAFAVGVLDARKVVSAAFKKAGSNVILVPLERDQHEMPCFERLEKNYDRIHKIIKNGKVLSATTVKMGGIAEAISKMCFGNKIGFEFKKNIDPNTLLIADLGSIILEVAAEENIEDIFREINHKHLGVTTEKDEIGVSGTKLKLDELISKWENPLEKIFPTKTDFNEQKPHNYLFKGQSVVKSKILVAKPRVFIPVFPGTNCEYETKRQFELAGAETEIFVVKNLSPKSIKDSIKHMVKSIDNSQIIMLPGGFSGGDEPDGSGKFIATAFRNPYIKEAVTKLLKERDGLMLGICNGFQALIKLGLLPYGEIRDLGENSPTLTFNTIGRHVSCMTKTKVVSRLSPWLKNTTLGEIYTVALSHGEGRFVANDAVMKELRENGQIATQYVDIKGDATYDIKYNPNGSFEAVEGITSPCGKIYGRMGHSERIGEDITKNVPGKKDIGLFKAGVAYFI